MTLGKDHEEKFCSTHACMHEESIAFLSLNKSLAVVNLIHTSRVINFPVSKQTAGKVQYARRGMDVHEYMVAFMYDRRSNHFRLPPYPYQRGQCRLRKISMKPRAYRSTWWRRSKRLIGVDPLNAGLVGTQYIDLHLWQCILKPVKMSSITEP